MAFSRDWVVDQQITRPSYMSFNSFIQSNFMSLSRCVAKARLARRTARTLFFFANALTQRNIASSVASAELSTGCKLQPATLCWPTARDVLSEVRNREY